MSAHNLDGLHSIAGRHDLQPSRVYGQMYRHQNYDRPINDIERLVKRSTNSPLDVACFSVLHPITIKMDVQIRVDLQLLRFRIFDAQESYKVLKGSRKGDIISALSICINLCTAKA